MALDDFAAMLNPPRMNSLDHCPRLVLGELLLEPHQHLSLDELERALGIGRTELEDAVAQLRRSGLVHATGGYCWPTRAAVECDRLLTI